MQMTSAMYAGFHAVCASKVYKANCSFCRSFMTSMEAPRHLLPVLFLVRGKRPFSGQPHPTHLNSCFLSVHCVDMLSLMNSLSHAGGSLRQNPECLEAGTLSLWLTSGSLEALTNPVSADPSQYNSNSPGPATSVSSRTVSSLSMF